MENKIKHLFSKKTASIIETVDNQPEPKNKQPKSFSLEQTFQAAIIYHQNGDAVNAQNCYQQILQHEPNHTDSLHYLGILYLQTGDYPHAIDFIIAAIETNPANATAAMYSNLGAVYRAQNHLESAMESFRQALKLEPQNVNALYNLSIVLQLNGKIEAAIDSYKQLILIQPNHAEAYYNLGTLFEQQENLQKAKEYYQQALVLNPNLSVAYFNLAVVLQKQGELEQAISIYQQAIQLKPDYAEAYYGLAVVFSRQNNVEEAIKNFQQAIFYKQDYKDVFYQLGCLYKQQNKRDKAAENYRKALQIQPDYLIYNDLASVVSDEESIGYYRQALALKPDNADIHYNLGVAAHVLGKWNIVLESYQQAISLQPSHNLARGALFHAQLSCCDWSSYKENSLKIVAAVQSGERGYKPFSFLAMSSSAAAQLACAKSYVAEKYPPAENHLWSGEIYKHNKIRIAYISADFRAHPVSYLMAGLFEQHDKSKFELIGLSLKPEENSQIGQRVKKAFDQFIDVSKLSDYEVGALINKLEIDIAVDLMGFTQYCRAGIFAHRPAPVQVNYLGFPATMGANYMDYIIVDNYLIPSEYQTFYTEKAVYLPECFQANDDKRTPPTNKPSRTSVGLPESAFVFCAFNNSYKFSPEFFDVWMRLLAKVEKSVLWILEYNPVATSNLQKEALKRGISAERLIFAPRVKLDEHLVRYQLADLFLDTLPCNAGTTASDALWAGVPVLTCSGMAMASRMAGSLLHAIGLPELIANNIEEYEALALKLATTPGLLAEIRTKLVQNRSTYPLFDTDRFRRHIESAYIMMWERHQCGETPVSFSVPASL